MAVDSSVNDEMNLSNCLDLGADNGVVSLLLRENNIQMQSGTALI